MNSKLKHELYINLTTMAAATPAIMTGTSHPGGDFSPHPNVKYTLRNNANVRRVASRRTSIFIYHLLTKNIVGETGVPDVPMGRTQSTVRPRLIDSVGVLRLDLLGLRGCSNPHGLRGALRPLAVHAAVVSLAGRPVATRCALARHAPTRTLGGGGVEVRDDPAQLAELSQNLVHLGLGWISGVERSGAEWSGVERSGAGT